MYVNQGRMDQFCATVAKHHGRTGRRARRTGSQRGLRRARHPSELEQRDGVRPGQDRNAGPRAKKPPRRHAECFRFACRREAAYPRLARGVSGEVGGMVALPLAILFAK